MHARRQRGRRARAGSGYAGMRPRACMQRAPAPHSSACGAAARMPTVRPLPRVQGTQPPNRAAPIVRCLAADGWRVRRVDRVDNPGTWTQPAAQVGGGSSCRGRHCCCARPRRSEAPPGPRPPPPSRGCCCPLARPGPAAPPPQRFPARFHGVYTKLLLWSLTEYERGERAWGQGVQGWPGGAGVLLWLDARGEQAGAGGCCRCAPRADPRRAPACPPPPPHPSRLPGRRHAGGAQRRRAVCLRRPVRRAAPQRAHQHGCAARGAAGQQWVQGRTAAVLACGAGCQTSSGSACGRCGALTPLPCPAALHPALPGVLVLTPSAPLFAAMMGAVASTPSYTGGDQGFIASFFAGGW